MAKSDVGGSARDERRRQMTEAELLDAIIDAAGYLGYRHYHPLYSPGSDRGWPDLTLVNPRQQRVIWAELKAPRGVVSNAQQEWVNDLVAAGCEAYIWYPEQWHSGAIETILRARPA